MNNAIDDVLGFHQKALSLRAYRQEVLASNIANVDTPNYKARDFDFKAALQGAMGARASLDMVRTAPGHLPGTGAGGLPGVRLQYRGERQSAVDGNTVDMDAERAAFAENALQYEASLTFINGYLRTLNSALQGQ